MKYTPTARKKMLMISAKIKPDMVPKLSSMQFSHTVGNKTQGGIALSQDVRHYCIFAFFCPPASVPLPLAAGASLYMWYDNRGSLPQELLLASVPLWEIPGTPKQFCHRELSEGEGRPDLQSRQPCSPLHCTPIPGPFLPTDLFAEPF